MKKTIFILLILQALLLCQIKFSGFNYYYNNKATINVCIGGGDYTTHDSIVGYSFIQGFNSGGNLGSFLIQQTEYGYRWYNKKMNIYFCGSSNIDAELAFAKTQNCNIYIRSTTGYDTLKSLNYYPHIQTFMPSGSNSHILTSDLGGNLPNLILTGCGTTSNLTSYEIEFYGIDPTGSNLASYSNGYIAGQIVYISNRLHTTIWNARKLARSVRAYDTENGYGNIDVNTLVNLWDGYISPDFYSPKLGPIGRTKVLTDTNDNTISVNKVKLGTKYIIEKQTENGIWQIVQTSSDTLFEDVDQPDGHYNYRYKALYENAYGEKQYTSYSDPSPTYILNTLPSLRVFLAGAYSGGVMSTQLKTLGYIPLTSPYSAVVADSIPSNITDWIKVELRSDSLTVVESRDLFLRKNGRIVDLDGTSYPTFSHSGNYYIVIKHRNHLAVMSSKKISIGAGYDFAESYTTVWNTGNTAWDAYKNLGDGNWGMIPGDVNEDYVTNDLDENIITTDFSQSLLGYLDSDLNLDGYCTSTDYNMLSPQMSKYSRVPRSPKVYYGGKTRNLYGNMDDDVTWTKGTGWSIANGTATCNGSQTDISDLYEYYFSFGKLTIGIQYLLDFDLTVTQGTMNHWSGSLLPNTETTSGHYQIRFTAGALYVTFRASDDFIGTVDNVATRQLLNP